MFDGYDSNTKQKFKNLKESKPSKSRKAKDSDSLMFSDSKNFKLTQKDNFNESLGAILERVILKNLKIKFWLKIGLQ